MRFKNLLTNKFLSRTFMVFFFLFFFMFVYNLHTMNIIMAMIMLQFSLAFKTWDLIRKIKEREEYDERI